ncbi:unnamed protein product [Notodromas monacha]|uniref:C2H2-type domain-containing protein n=1 Tax=Notodromas monacha TaxID=399045 RepID=A0A7R9G868_9CRUS|nr:unnamed protein product [Notodromas monacha]CAG0912818.1 unnamed protein product [Notodromas monacha]
MDDDDIVFLEEVSPCDSGRNVAPVVKEDYDLEDGEIDSDDDLIPPPPKLKTACDEDWDIPPPPVLNQLLRAVVQSNEYDDLSDGFESPVSTKISNSDPVNQETENFSDGWESPVGETDNKERECSVSNEESDQHKLDLPQATPSEPPFQGLSEVPCTTISNEAVTTPPESANESASFVQDEHSDTSAAPCVAVARKSCDSSPARCSQEISDVQSLMDLVEQNSVDVVRSGGLFPSLRAADADSQEVDLSTPPNPTQCDSSPAQCSREISDVQSLMDLVEEQNSVDVERYVKAPIKLLTGDKLFVCPGVDDGFHCGKLFQFAHKLREHWGDECSAMACEIHCPHCTKKASFVDIDQYYDHLLAHAEDPQCVCSVCGLLFRDNHSLNIRGHWFKKHQEIEGLPNLWPMTNLEDASALVGRRLQIDHNLSRGPLFAVLANFKLERNELLRDFTGLPECLPFKWLCACCNFTSNLSADIHKHVKLHLQETIDPLIGSSFGSDQCLHPNASTESEAPDIPYVSEDFRYMCGCGYHLTSEIELHYHLELVHADSDDEFQCPHCPSYASVSKADFIDHLKLHGPRLYRCTSCSVYSINGDVMKQHIVEKHGNGGQSRDADIVVIRDANLNALHLKDKHPGFIFCSTLQRFVEQLQKDVESEPKQRDNLRDDDSVTQRMLKLKLRFKDSMKYFQDIIRVAPKNGDWDTCLKQAENMTLIEFPGDDPKNLAEFLRERLKDTILWSGDHTL